jgi:hypothetical protein
VTSTGIPARLFPVTVTIRHAPVTTDRYGNTARDWSRASTVSTPAWVERQAGRQGSGSGESLAGRDELYSTFRLVLPVGVLIEGRDRVDYDGRTFEVQGPPDTVLTPRGAHHIEAILLWREG